MLHLATYTRDLFMDASMREKKEKKQHKEGFEPTMSYCKASVLLVCYKCCQSMYWVTESNLFGFPNLGVVVQRDIGGRFHGPWWWPIDQLTGEINSKLFLNFIRQLNLLQCICKQKNTMIIAIQFLFLKVAITLFEVLIFQWYITRATFLPRMLQFSKIDHCGPFPSLFFPLLTMFEWNSGFSRK